MRRKKKMRDAIRTVEQRQRIVVEGGNENARGKMDVLTATAMRKNGTGRKVGSRLRDAETRLDSSGRLRSDDLRSTCSNQFQPSQSSSPSVVSCVYGVRSQLCIRDRAGLARDRPIGEKGAIISNPRRSRE